MNNVELNKLLGRVTSGDEIDRLLDEYGQHFNVVNAVTAIQTVARLNLVMPNELPNVVSEVLSTSDRVESRHVSSILWSCAKMKYKNADLLGATIMHADYIEDFKPQEVSLVLWSLGKLGVKSGCEAFVNRMMKIAEKCAQNMTCQGLSNVIGGLANLQVTPTREILNIIEKHVRSFKIQELTNVTMSLAKLDIEISESIVAELQRNVQLFSPLQIATASAALSKQGKDISFLKQVTLKTTFSNQELSMIVSAVCSSPHWKESEKSQFVKSKLKHVEKLDLQQVASFLVAVSKLENADTRGLVMRAIAVIDQFSADDLENVTIAIAKFDRTPETDLLVGIERASLSIFETLSCRNVANIVWGLAKSGFTGELFLSCIETSTLLDQFNARDLSNLAWGVAMISPTNFKTLLEKISCRAVPIIDQFNAQECSKLLFAMEKGQVENEMLKQVTSEEKSFSMEVGGKTVTVSYIPGGGRNLEPCQRELTGTTAATGGALWQDSVILAQLLADGDLLHISAVRELMDRNLRSWNSLRGKVCVELGAGTALPSIVAATLGMNVVATDGDNHVLEIMNQNFQRNECESLRLVKLKWGCKDPLKKMDLAKVDLVIGTGLVYGKDPQVWESLSDTLVKICGKKTLVLLSHGNGAAPKVHKLKGDFYESVKQHFDVIQIPTNHHGCQIHALMKRNKKRNRDD